MHLKRHIILLVCLLLTFSSGVRAVGSNWMAALPDTVKVCRVSIPGTHDSGTAGVRFPMKHYARTQTMDLAEQWDAGIRFFDLRPKLEGGKLKIFHGPANCHITFKESLLILKRKLEENPTEFCIVMTNLAGGGQQAADMTMDEIRNIIPDIMLAAFKSDMTVADIRGRILFIHRNSPSRGVEAPGALVRGWPGNGTSRKSRMVSSDEKSAELWAQDYFTSGNNDPDAYLDRKWDNMHSLLQAYRSAADGVWCINHASGYTGTGISTNIKRNFNSTNMRLLDYLRDSDSPVGIIPMDFPHQELIDAIIDCNK